jgi:hypothetical protein
MGKQNFSPKKKKSLKDSSGKKPPSGMKSPGKRGPIGHDDI